MALLLFTQYICSVYVCVGVGAVGAVVSGAGSVSVGSGDVGAGSVGFGSGTVSAGGDSDGIGCVSCGEVATVASGSVAKAESGIAPTVSTNASRSATAF